MKQLNKFMITIFAAMILRNFYIFMLYCSGLILMAHIVLPHHHNASGTTDQSVVKHQSSHHDDHYGHHHHKKTSNEEPASNNPISHPLHQESITQFVTKQTIVSAEMLRMIYLIPAYINTTFTIPSKINRVHYKPDKSNLNCNYYHSCFSLRGPPSMLHS